MNEIIKDLHDTEVVQYFYQEYIPLPRAKSKKAYIPKPATNPVTEVTLDTAVTLDTDTSKSFYKCKLQ